jgi:hypothetical protein
MSILFSVSIQFWKKSISPLLNGNNTPLAEGAPDRREKTAKKTQQYQNFLNRILNFF